MRGNQGIITLPLGRRLGVRDKQRPKAQPSATLEGFYKLLGRTPKEVSAPVLRAQATNTSFPCCQPPFWGRRADRLYHKHSNTMCLLKCFFILLMYTIRAMGSYCCLLFAQKPWVWDHTVCWLRYPQQPLLPALGWFYLLELSFYCSLVITLPFDVKRKDFKEQIIHHIATITLIFVSYCANLIRLGVMIMLVHDASDYLLELAKILHYMKWKQICKAVFMVFAVVFISSRLVIFPLITYYYYVTKFEMFFLSCLINAFLMILQLLHIFWSYLILRMTFGLILYGAVRKIFFSSMTTRSSVVLHTCKERVGEKGLPNQTGSPRSPVKGHRDYKGPGASPV
uniref:TLC domain-containing protein n=1 Tax=Pavo cristatus TaxID=9049 RepID=A0A8C9ERJ4_PAVCR